MCHVKDRGESNTALQIRWKIVRDKAYSICGSYIGLVIGQGLLKKSIHTYNNATARRLFVYIFLSISWHSKEVQAVSAKSKWRSSWFKSKSLCVSVDDVREVQMWMQSGGKLVTCGWKASPPNVKGPTFGHHATCDVQCMWAPTCEMVSQKLSGSCR